MIATPWTPRIRHRWSKSTMVKSLKSWQADITGQNIPTQKMTTLHVSTLLIIFLLIWFYTIQYIWLLKILICTFIHWANINISPMYKGIFCVWCADWQLENVINKMSVFQFKGIMHNWSTCWRLHDQGFSIYYEIC